MFVLHKQYKSHYRNSILKKTGILKEREKLFDTINISCFSSNLTFRRAFFCLFSFNIVQTVLCFVLNTIKMGTL